jgi:hypothetical protein
MNELLKKASERLTELQRLFNERVIKRENLKGELKQVEADLEATGGAIQDCNFWISEFKKEIVAPNIVVKEKEKFTEEQLGQAIEKMNE